MRVVEEIMVLICFICPVSGAGDQFFRPIMSIYTIHIQVIYTMSIYTKHSLVCLHKYMNLSDFPFLIHRV